MPDKKTNNKKPPVEHQHRIIPGGVVPIAPATLFDSIKSGFGWSIGRNMFGGQKEKEPTEFERCLAEHREDIAYCAQFAEKK